MRRMAQSGTAHGSAHGSAALLCALLLLSSLGGAQLLDAASEEQLSPRALRDFYPKGPNLTSEKQLVRAACPSSRRPAARDGNASAGFLEDWRQKNLILSDCFVFSTHVCLFVCGNNDLLLFFFLKLGALQEVLEKLQAKRLPMWEKKYGQVPTVGPGSGHRSVCVCLCAELSAVVSVSV